MNSQPINRKAQREAHNFIALLFNELPETWHEDIADAQLDLELWLACFAEAMYEKPQTGLVLLNTVRKRAQAYYRNDLKQPHHTPTVWSFFRLQLELALLRTIGADDFTIRDAMAYSVDLVGGFAERIDFYGAEQPDKFYTWTN